MNPFSLTIAGLIVDMLGVYFLAIEAIGVERLRRLRESRFRGASRSANPDAVAPDSQGEQAHAARDEARSGFNDPGCVVASGLLGGVTLVTLLVALYVLGVDLIEIVWSAIGPIYLLTAFIILFLLIPFLVVLSILVGMLIYRVFVLILHAPVSFIEYTERRYAAGTAGLLGFLLLILGLMLQLLASVLQQRASGG